MSTFLETVILCLVASGVICFIYGLFYTMGYSFTKGKMDALYDMAKKGQVMIVEDLQSERKDDQGE